MSPHLPSKPLIPTTVQPNEVPPYYPSSRSASALSLFLADLFAPDALERVQFFTIFGLIGAAIVDLAEARWNFLIFVCLFSLASDYVFLKYRERRLTHHEAQAFNYKVGNLEWLVGLWISPLSYTNISLAFVTLLNVSSLWDKEGISSSRRYLAFASLCLWGMLWDWACYHLIFKDEAGEWVDEKETPC
ncbi:hypothetical protein QBC42DRAFT_270770 [Cladorrhinum samala]|uniref:Uncharacterized protein n=1 Tax=Cladorrhinum samala TaxID=585594 RepID=A0AAV9HK21_9PEZI|nr:hypothetical protein QBC42DRAFT_270770 [Cladorrhinum samala]